MAALRHKSLNGSLNGLQEDAFVHYRGIPYGTVTERFTNPKRLDDHGGAEVDCTKFGPRCPQVKVDVGYLLREPEGDVFYDETEDEFKCLNLDVAVPSGNHTSALPVFLWIHGGSQIVSYGNGASKLGDVRKLVTDSVSLGMPIIVVSVQYRLNIFAVGDGPESKNYALKDLQCAVDWVRQHIAGFGGDPDNITLAGESAGAVLSHALVVAGAKVRRLALLSGSLYLSPPRPHEAAKAAVIHPIAKSILSKGHNIRKAPVDELIDAQTHIPIVSVFLQEEAALGNWATTTGEVQEFMIGDCEFESAIFRNGVEALPSQAIEQAFAKAGKFADDLKKLYHINMARPSSCRAGALDFLNDSAFAFAVGKLKSLYEEQGKKVYAYAFDQTNPWQSSARAHHAVDLLYLFEGFSLKSNPTAMTLAKEMRRRYISFVNGVAPWSAGTYCAFGPHGEVGEVNDDELRARRRIEHLEFLQRMPPDLVMAVRGGLAAGTLSLAN